MNQGWFFLENWGEPHPNPPQGTGEGTGLIWDGFFLEIVFSSPVRYP